MEICPDCEVALVEPESDPRPSGDEPSGHAVVVLRTGKIFEADLAASVLEEAGVPHFRREQSSGGLTFAMPAAPSVGPGNWWVILVPEEAAEEARSILEQLPLDADNEPGVWDFAPSPQAKSFFKSWAFFTLLLFALAFAVGLVSALRGL